MNWVFIKSFIQKKFQDVFLTLEQRSIRPHIIERQELTGYHGTSFSAAQDIKRTEWILSKEDRRLGPGVYFYQDTEKMPGAKAAYHWAANPTRISYRPCHPDPCVMTCKVHGVRLLDMTTTDNQKYLSELQQGFIVALEELPEELRRQNIPVDICNRVRYEMRNLGEHFIGKQINIHAPWRDSVDAIRTFFACEELHKDFFGFVVARKIESIEIIEITRH